MSDLTENEILQCHAQALHDAKGACELLGKNAMEGYLAPRGHNYGNLQRALDKLEGSARQMCHWREDARWLRIGIFYGGIVKRKMQAAFVGQRWKFFHEAQAIFDKGLREMETLATAKTGRRGFIIPERTDFLVLPDHRVPQPNRGTAH